MQDPNLRLVKPDGLPVDKTRSVSMPQPRIVLVFRKPRPSSYSIEYLFHEVYDELRKDHQIEKFVLPCYSEGFINRVMNVISLMRYRNCIIHITGDTYYAVLGALFCKRLIT